MALPVQLSLGGGFRLSRPTKNPFSENGGKSIGLAIRTNFLIWPPKAFFVCRTTQRPTTGPNLRLSPRPRALPIPRACDGGPRRQHCPSRAPPPPSSCVPLSLPCPGMNPRLTIRGFAHLVIKPLNLSRNRVFDTKLTTPNVKPPPHIHIPQDPIEGQLNKKIKSCLHQRRKSKKVSNREIFFS